jgi:hypothetical protein
VESLSGEIGEWDRRGEFWLILAYYCSVGDWGEGKEAFLLSRGEYGCVLCLCQCAGKGWFLATKSSTGDVL